MTIPTTAPDTVSLSLPAGWVEIPLEPGALQTRMRANVEALDPDAAGSVEFRRLLLLLGQVVERVERAGVVMLFAYVEDVKQGEATDDEEPYLVSAVGWLATQRQPAQATRPLRFADVEAAAEKRSREGGRQRVEAPRVRDLAGEPSLREVWLRTIDGPGLDAPTEVLETRYSRLIGEDDGLAVMGFTTPNLELASELTALFDAIADTLELVTA
jgi:hypothetical protein